MNLTDNQSPILYHTQGQSGRNGQHGQPGLGGKQGKSYYGVYVKQTMGFWDRDDFRDDLDDDEKKEAKLGIVSKTLIFLLYGGVLQLVGSGVGCALGREWKDGPKLIPSEERGPTGIPAYEYNDEDRAVTSPTQPFSEENIHNLQTLFQQYKNTID